MKYLGQHRVNNLTLKKNKLFMLLVLGWVFLALPLITLTGIIHPQKAEAVGDPVIMGAGDIANGNYEKQTSDLILSQRSSAEGLSAVLTMGDNAYSDGTDAQFAARYNPTWGRFKDITKPSAGNHDYHTANAQGYYNYFFGGTRTGNEYYAYDIGAWRFYSLNSNITRDAASAQVNWLKADLAAQPKSKCMAAYWHHPRYSSSSKHGSDTSTGVMYQALLDGGADVVLVGHDHSYERFAPQDNAGKASSTGIRQILVGSGGNMSYALGTRLANSEASYQKDGNAGVFKMTLRSDSYDFRFVPIAGTPFTDSFTDTCRNGGSTVPGPTVSSVSPSSGTTAGGTQVTLTGTNFAAGATVKFGGVSATAVTVNSSTSITALAPAHASGIVDVAVTSGGLTYTKLNGYTFTTAPLPAPIVASLSLANGPAQGGTNVTISGSNFRAGATVSFGSTAATNVVVVSGSAITATVPAGTAGTAVAVTVRNSDGTQGTKNGAFTYNVVPPPGNCTAGPAAPTDKGTVIQSVNVPAAGSYHVWTRVKAANTNDNSVYLRVDDCAVDVVGDAGSISTTSWQWVDYKNGVSTTKLDHQLSLGGHQIVLSGRENGVKVDRVLLVSGTCIPTGTGDNCGDTTVPTATITSPNGGTTVSGTINLSAGASDNNGPAAISSVTFLVDGIAVGTDSSSPYQVSWDSKTVSNANHTLQAKATDVAGNTGSSTNVSFTVDNIGSANDTIPPAVSITSPANNSTVSGTFNLNTNATDNVGVTKVEYFLGYFKFAEDTTAPYGVPVNTSGLANGVTQLTARAYDAAGNSTFSDTITVTVNNTTGSTTTLTYLPTDDATIRSGSPNTNYGSATKLEADGDPVDSWLMKFNVTGLNGRQVQSAKLVLTNVNDSDLGGVFYKLTNSSWNEGTVTWSNAPTGGTQIGSLGKVVEKSVYQVNLSGLTTDGVLSLRVNSNKSNGADFASSEATAATTRPKLLITVVN